MVAGLGVGFWFIVFALVFLAAILAIVGLRRSLNMPVNAAPVTSSSPSVALDGNAEDEAVLTVQPGGRIEYISARAREWFGLREDEYPQLEKLSRAALPADDFLDLCAMRGRKRISIGGRLVEATSYPVPGPYPLMLLMMRSVDLIR